MFRNYFKTAVRNIRRHKTFSIINVAGLSVGIAASLLLFIVVKHELSYDGFQKNYESIYHLVTKNKYSNGITYNPGISVPALDALRAEMPGTEFAALFSSYGSQLTIENTANITSDKKFIEDKGIFFCEPQFFQVFHYEWIAGNAKVLNEPNNVVLTEKMAEKYFGSWQKAMGKIILLDNTITLKVAGILKDVPSNTDFPLRVLASYRTLKDNPKLYGVYSYSTEWASVSSNFQVFMLMPPHVTAAYMNRQLSRFSEEHFSKKQSHQIIFLQPLSKLHFDTRFQASFGDHVTSMSILWTLSLIGIFILLMACINFINLATAQAFNRSKEIGIRKVLGGSRPQLFRQVMSETAFIVLIALVLALGIAWLCLPLIKHVASIDTPLTLFHTSVVAFLLVILILVTALSGLYPALIMSGFNPIQALKNRIASANVGGVSLKRSLVVTQFSISQALIACTIVAISQMSFVRRASMGFDKEAVLILAGSNDSSALTRLPAFKQALLQIPGVQSVSFNSDVPSSDNFWSTNFAYDHRPDESYQVYLKYADTSYFKTFGIPLIAGTVYKASDTINQVVINETLVHKLQIKSPEYAVGRQIRIGGGWHTIAGVVRDFHTASLKTEIQPLVISTWKHFYGNTAIKLRTNDIPKTQASIQVMWTRFFPEYAYSSSFMDQNIAQFYKQDRQLSLLYWIFSMLAIFISCLGLYGLISQMVTQKTKEMGIRKVLGASVSHIVYLFSREFTLLVIIAFAVAVPVSWYLMHQWLNNFAYHIGMSWWIFLLAGVTAMIIAWVTVGVKAVKAAMRNPVESLRTE